MSFSLSVSQSFFMRVNKPDGFNKPAVIDTCAVNPALRVRLYPSWYQQIGLEWTFPTDWGNCQFNVYFSQGEPQKDGTGEFVKLNGQLLDTCFFFDTSTQEYSKFHQGYYVVEAVLLDKGGATMRSPAATWHNKQRRWVELRSIEVQRREYWLLSKFGGVKSYLFRKRMYGKRCPSCWDPVSQAVLRDHCPVCYGTSFEGGYLAPVPLYVQYETTPNNRVKTYFGHLEQNQLGAWTISYPTVNPEDVLIRIGDWNVYEVVNLQTTELQAKPVRQMLTLTQLGKKDIENELVKQCLAEFPTEFAGGPKYSPQRV